MRIKSHRLSPQANFAALGFGAYDQDCIPYGKVHPITMSLSTTGSSSEPFMPSYEGYPNSGLSANSVSLGVSFDVDDSYDNLIVASVNALSGETVKRPQMEEAFDVPSAPQLAFFLFSLDELPNLRQNSNESRQKEKRSEITHEIKPIPSTSCLLWSQRLT